MDERNYGSLEACQRLDAAGIVLETEYWWNPIDIIEGDHTVISGYELKDYKILGSIPAPLMAEVWRDLLDEITDTVYWSELGGKEHAEEAKYYPVLSKDEEETAAEYRDSHWQRCENSNFQNINPTDALIDLLIFVEQRKEE